MRINKSLLKVITITLVITNYTIAQSKINVNHLLDYGGLKFMPNSDKPFNGRVFELYDNGQKHWEKRYIKGIADGYYRSWYINGQLEFKGRIKQGVKNGLYLSYNEDGKKIKEAHYKDDILHGPFVLWFPNGNKNIECSYQNGNLNMKYTS
ncbi:uncharacterized protein METZ01_LOCUS277616, partial [marine metagenome]